MSSHRVAPLFKAAVKQRTCKALSEVLSALCNPIPVDGLRRNPLLSQRHGGTEKNVSYFIEKIHLMILLRASVPL